MLPTLSTSEWTVGFHAISYYPPSNTRKLAQVSRPPPPRRLIYNLSSRWHSDPPTSSRLSTGVLPPRQPHRSQMSPSAFQSHLTVLESSARLYPTRPAFRLPVVNKETSEISEWATVTYAQFHRDVELYARYWTSILSAGGVAPGSIVGFWCVSRTVPVDDPRSPTSRWVKGSKA